MDAFDTLEKYSEETRALRTQFNLLQEQLKDAEDLLSSRKENLANVEKAGEVIKKVAAITQQHLKVHIDNIVGLALNAVFPGEFEFSLDFVERRGKIEADIHLIKDGKKCSPMDEVGGGVVDVLAFSLRIAVWSLKKTSPTMVLDEPFRFLSKGLQTRAGAILKELSERLNMQFIVVSHEPAIIESADKFFEIDQVDGVSFVV